MVFSADPNSFLLRDGREIVRNFLDCRVKPGNDKKQK